MEKRKTKINEAIAVTSIICISVLVIVVMGAMTKQYSFEADCSADIDWQDIQFTEDEPCFTTRDSSICAMPTHLQCDIKGELPYSTITIFEKLVKVK